MPELRSIEDPLARTEPSTSTWRRPRSTEERHHVPTDDTEGNGRRIPPAHTKLSDDTEGHRRRWRKVEPLGDDTPEADDAEGNRRRWRK